MRGAGRAATAFSCGFAAFGERSEREQHHRNRQCDNGEQRARRVSRGGELLFPALLFGKGDDARCGRHRHRNDGREQHIGRVREQPRKLEGENEKIGERHRKDEPCKRRKVDIFVAEELLGGKFRHAHAHDEHGKGRRHAARIGDDLLELLDFFHVEDVDLRDKEEEKADDGAHRAGVEERLFEGDFSFILRDEVSAERPDEQVEGDVEDGDIHHRLAVAAREHIDEGDAHERAVGEGADEHEDIALFALRFALLIEEDELCRKEGEKERRKRKEEHP